ncbi:hypothetical protein A1W7_04322 [Escherichia coli KTE87]|nr:hypothetical protein A1W7_04322 [Escherichia coli KTE87]
MRNDELTLLNTQDMKRDGLSAGEKGVAATAPLLTTEKTATTRSGNLMMVNASSIPLGETNGAGATFLVGEDKQSTTTAPKQESGVNLGINTADLGGTGAQAAKHTMAVSDREKHSDSGKSRSPSLSVSALALSGRVVVFGFATHSQTQTITGRWLWQG